MHGMKPSAVEGVGKMIEKKDPIYLERSLTVYKYGQKMIDETSLLLENK